MTNAMRLDFLFGFVNTRGKSGFTIRSFGHSVHFDKARLFSFGYSRLQQYAKYLTA